MRIALTVDPDIPVPPTHYGGIERVVDMLARGLVKRGHSVTLFAHPASSTAGLLLAYGVPPHVGWRARVTELAQVGAGLWRRRGEFDLVHSFGRLRALLPVLPLRALPKLQSYQREQVPWRGVKMAVRLAGESLRFTACSRSVCAERPRHGVRGGRWHVIANGVEMAKYDFVVRVGADAPLVFLGRLEPFKGAHHAIAIARAAGRRLIIAGNQVASGPDVDYFGRRIAPEIDGACVTYVGPVDDGQKNALLGSAAALLMPVEWEEPFGIVMAEALACGTPIIGFARGSVPEIVEHGVNGYLCQTADEAVAAVRGLDRIDRATVRADCVARFSDHVVVDGYERLYREMLGR